MVQRYTKNNILISDNNIMTKFTDLIILNAQQRLFHPSTINHVEIADWLENAIRNKIALGWHSPCSTGRCGNNCLCRENIS
jgi:hypothetical protein